MQLLLARQPAEVTQQFRRHIFYRNISDLLAVEAVSCEPVSLIFAQYQGDFRKKQRADYEKSQKCPQTCGFSLSRQIREQGETGSIDRRKQGNEFADSGSKKFRAAKCAAHGWAGLIPKRTSDRRGRLNGKVRNVLVSRSVPTESRVLSVFNPKCPKLNFAVS